MIEYITLSDLVKKVSQDAVEKGKEIFNTKKIREKYLNIFEMMNIDRDKLKASDGKKSKDFKIPKDSQNFLINVYWLYSDADMKKMRKGFFEQASLESIAELLDGFREMILKLDIPENDKDEMISKMYLRTKYPYLQRRAEVLKELENIKLDFCPDYQDDARVEDELQNYVDNNDIKNIIINDYLKRVDEINVDYNSNSNDRVFLLVEIANEEVLKNLLKIQEVEGLMISSNFAVIITPANKVDEVKKLVIRIVNIDEFSTILTLNDISPVEASGAPVFNTNPYLKLNGRGVLVGVIDTGIDYLNKEFQMEDDTTRIVRLWDQTIQGDTNIYGLKYGTEYTEEQINQAISLQTSGGDPYSIVPSKDEIGHGTKVSGIIGGRGINPDLKGAAPDCKFVIVKLSRATKVELDAALIDKTDVPSYNPWSVLLGIRYVVSVARELNKPLVIFIPLGSNMGSHTGNGIDENIINNYSTEAATVFVVPVGNQGNTDTHTEGIIEKVGDIKDIEIRVGEKHNGDKKRCQHSPPYNRNIQQHFQCNGTAQDFRQRSGNGSQHRRSEYRTGYPFGSVFSGRFREAEPGDNPQVGNIMLKNDQHDSRQGDHPK